MLFNSLEFLIFLPIVLIAYWVVLRKYFAARKIALLVASYVFYAWWDWRFLFLLIFSTLLDYATGLMMSNTTQQTQKKKWFWLSVVVNLGFLAIFKYYNFFIYSFVGILEQLHIKASFPILNIVLPVGISFYTFHGLSYVIDIYYDRIKAERNFVNYAVFVSFFPLLVAGPIERATHLLPQFKIPKEFNYNNIAKGIRLMLWGFFMKLVVANRVSIYVDAVYNNIQVHGGITFIMATMLFAFQIYADFAGYSLIAIGTAKLFNYDLLINFRKPYFSHSVSEFWTRWHISLSSWFRDYLYIPLGGNRGTKFRWLFNLFITFLISGLWHGANWTFVIWGALNGIFLIIEALLNKRERKGIANIIITFILINFTWIFFRANSVQDAWYIIKTIFSEPGKLYIGMGSDITVLLYSLIAVGLLVIAEAKREFFSNYFSFSKHSNVWVKLIAYAILCFIIFYLGVFDDSQFIYFQF